MKKVVIAGSASLQKEIKHWISLWEHSGYEILDYPTPISPDNFLEEYPKAHANFFNNIEKADILFIMNENKNGITGYIGAESFAEMGFGVAQNLIHGKKIEIMILQVPESRVQSHEEIELWLKLGWIKLYRK